MVRPLSRLRDSLIERSESVSVAESVTAGNIQASLSVAKHAMEFFAGGITTYNISQKVKHLKVDRKHAQRVNCVSRKVACEMALGVTRLFDSDWSIAITGYAAPVPEKNITSLFAWVAISHKGKVVTTRRVALKKTGPLAAQHEYTKQAIRLLATCLEN